MKLIPFTYATRNLGRSTSRLALSIGGSALVVLLVVSGVAFVRGMEGSISASGLASNVILLGAGSEESLERSEIPVGSAAEAVASIEGLRVELGTTMASREVHVAFPVAAGEGVRPDTGDRLPAETGVSDEFTSANLGVIRGFTPIAFGLHPQVRLSEGRLPEPGANEVIIGRTAARRIGLDLAGSPWMTVDRRPFAVVGVIDAPGTVMEGEIWMPLSDLLTLAQRETISAVVVSLDSATFDDVDAFAQRRFDLELAATREADYYSALAAFFRPVQVMVVTSAGLVGLGALLGGLNIMFAAFAGRIREFGTLQVLGYSRKAIVVSMIQESLLASMSGAVLACAISVPLLSGAAIEFSMGTFALQVDAPAIAAGLTSGILIGIGGAILPAIRCLRPSVPQALKSD